MQKEIKVGDMVHDGEGTQGVVLKVEYFIAPNPHATSAQKEFIYVLWRIGGLDANTSTERL